MGWQNRGVQLLHLAHLLGLQSRCMQRKVIAHAKQAGACYLVGGDVLDVRLHDGPRQGVPAVQAGEAQVAQVHLHAAPGHQVQHLPTTAWSTHVGLVPVHGRMWKRVHGVVRTTRVQELRPEPVG